jgi:hypothetical protein
MTVSINQPAYLPWLGYFNRIALSDLHIVLDHVQFEKNSFVNRNKARTRQGWTWLTVPLATKGRFGHLSINSLSIAPNDPWARKHWTTIRTSYARAPFFKDLAPAYEALYTKPWTDFLPMARDFMRQHLADLAIDTPVLSSSTLGVQGTKSDLVLNLCRAVGADIYLSGPLGRDYLDEASFASAGIDIKYQDFEHPIYKQCQPGPFEPAMGVLDLLFNLGPSSRALVLKGSSRPQAA